MRALRQYGLELFLAWTWLSRSKVIDRLVRWGEVNLLFNVTIYDISVIYVTAHRCAGGLKKKLYLRSGSQRHRHFVGFFNVPVQAPTRGHPFHTVIPWNRPINSHFTITLGIRRTHSRLNPPPPGPHGGFSILQGFTCRVGRALDVDTCPYVPVSYAYELVSDAEVPLKFRLHHIVCLLHTISGSFSHTCTYEVK